MYKVRRWVVRHSQAFETIYIWLEQGLVKLHPVMQKIGYQRLEKPVAIFEKLCKGLLFDCKMCGDCALSATGMSCSMNCPKNIRNGPCGGVRQNGNCEVQPEMRCVWMDAWQGSQSMRAGKQIHAVQLPVDHTLQGSSAWLRKVREVVVKQEQSSK